MKYLVEIACEDDNKLSTEAMERLATSIRGWVERLGWVQRIASVTVKEIPETH